MKLFAIARLTTSISIFLVGMMVGIIFFTMILPCVLPKTPSLVEVVNQAPYSPMEYEENVFDCSNMASMLDAWLEYHGYESWLLIFNKLDGSSAGHVVILAEGRLFEPTTKTPRDGLVGGQSVTIEYNDRVYVFTPLNLADGTYSNHIQTIDSPEQLGIINMDEWAYPKRW